MSTSGPTELNVNLLGTRSAPRRYWIACDESKPMTGGAGWLYLCLVIVAEEDVESLVAKLAADREGTGNAELHFSRITRHEKATAARAWLDRAMTPGSPIRFHILGIDTRRLQSQAFGAHGTDQRRRIYTRFFRSAVAYAVKAHCASPFVVTRVLHDESPELVHDDVFDWHSIWRLRKDHELPLACDRVTFVDSDHNVGDSADATLVQLADVILGATRVALDATTGKTHQLEIARHFLPLVERLTDDARSRNRRSRYGHVGRCSVSFFPRRALTLEELDDPAARARSGFYRARIPLLAVDDRQMTLGFE